MLLGLLKFGIKALLTHQRSLVNQHLVHAWLGRPKPHRCSTLVSAWRNRTGQAGPPCVLQLSSVQGESKHSWASAVWNALAQRAAGATGAARRVNILNYCWVHETCFCLLQWLNNLLQRSWTNGVEVSWMQVLSCTLCSAGDGRHCHARKDFLQDKQLSVWCQSEACVSAETLVSHSSTTNLFWKDKQMLKFWNLRCEFSLDKWFFGYVLSVWKCWL